MRPFSAKTRGRAGENRRFPFLCRFHFSRDEAEPFVAFVRSSASSERPPAFPYCRFRLFVTFRIARSGQLSRWATEKSSLAIAKAPRRKERGFSRKSRPKSAERFVSGNFPFVIEAISFKNGPHPPESRRSTFRKSRGHEKEEPTSRPCPPSCRISRSCRRFRSFSIPCWNYVSLHTCNHRGRTIAPVQLFRKINAHEQYRRIRSLLHICNYPKR